MLTFGFGEQQAKELLDAYLQQLMAVGVNNESPSIDPLYFYARYLVWKLQRSHAKVGSSTSQSFSQCHTFPHVLSPSTSYLLTYVPLPP